MPCGIEAVGTKDLSLLVMFNAINPGLTIEREGPLTIQK